MTATAARPAAGLRRSKCAPDRAAARRCASGQRVQFLQARLCQPVGHRSGDFLSKAAARARASDRTRSRCAPRRPEPRRRCPSVRHEAGRPGWQRLPKACKGHPGLGLGIGTEVGQRSGAWGQLSPMMRSGDIKRPSNVCAIVREPCTAWVSDVELSNSAVSMASCGSRRRAGRRSVPRRWARAALDLTVERSSWPDRLSSAMPPRSRSCWARSASAAHQKRPRDEIEVTLIQCCCPLRHLGAAERMTQPHAGGHMPARCPRSQYSDHLGQPAFEFVAIAVRAGSGHPCQMRAQSRPSSRNAVPGRASAGSADAFEQWRAGGRTEAPQGSSIASASASQGVALPRRMTVRKAAPPARHSRCRSSRYWRQTLIDGKNTVAFAPRTPR